MREWKGLCKCEVCGKIGTWTWAEMVRDLGYHYASNIVPVCRGKLVPHDRRVPDPEKQELIDMVEAWEHIYRYLLDHPEDVSGLRRLRAQHAALLRHHEGGEG